MRYIKLYEEFRHDEIHDVMMSICDTVSFKESTEYPSSERVRVYDVDSSVDFDPKKYEEYLEGWIIIYNEYKDRIIFIKGDLKEAGLSWLNEIYGKLEPIEKDDRIYYVDGERMPLLYYYKKHQESKNGYYYINYNRIWSFFDSYFSIELISVWLGETYNLRGLTPCEATLTKRQQVGRDL